MRCEHRKEIVIIKEFVNHGKNIVTTDIAIEGCIVCSKNVKVEERLKRGN